MPFCYEVEIRELPDFEKVIVPKTLCPAGTPLFPDIVVYPTPQWDYQGNEVSLTLQWTVIERDNAEFVRARTRGDIAGSLPLFEDVADWRISPPQNDDPIEFNQFGPIFRCGAFGLGFFALYIFGPRSYVDYCSSDLPKLED